MCLMCVLDLYIIYHFSCSTLQEHVDEEHAQHSLCRIAWYMCCICMCWVYMLYSMLQEHVDENTRNIHCVGFICVWCMCCIYICVLDLYVIQRVAGARGWKTRATFTATQAIRPQHAISAGRGEISCHIHICHVTHEWVMSRTFESCHIHPSHVT